MNKNLLAVIILLFMGAALVLSLVSGEKETVPDINPPEGVTDVHFLKRAHWQTMRYFYRFSASPEVCEEFIISLMKKQGFGKEIKGEAFTEFPVRVDSPSWFDVGTVRKGKMLIGDGRAYGVIDTASEGRMYYYLGY